MRGRHARIAVVAILSFLVAGCVSIRAIGSDRFYVHYTKNEAFKTRVPLVLMYVDSGAAPRRLALTLPADSGIRRPAGLYAAPAAIDIHAPPRCADEQRKFCYWKSEDVVELVPIGTELTLSRIKRYAGFSLMYGGGQDLVPFAMLRSRSMGPIEVDISDLSDFQVGEKIDGHPYDIPAPSPSLIEKE